ncbi:hypothetical protein EP073_04365 [Geovibrio thiophilus]|uniref:Uncharacterized protein n=1 Tax=Geovibrio thiophilus TaxID=139438 RepID=A0A410JX80_9BACT|nr:hypothetical protein [Geovibrio thiophilus]QAR32668.1 hypothetical protein EP073_04365 [Geovibrio thiophilus]
MKSAHALEAQLSKTEIIIERIRLEHAYGRILCGLLKFAETERTFNELIQYINTAAENTYLLQPPSVIISWLISTEAIRAENSSTENERWRTSAEGCAALEALGYTQNAGIISNEPEFKEIYIKILRFCFTPRTRDEIEDMLETPLRDCSVQPGYFISNLEETGSLEWRGKWTTAENVKNNPELSDY